MKTKFYTIFSLLVAVLSMTACSPDMDRVFDEDGSARIEAFNKTLKETLMSAPNGWRMEYYASTTYGGYNVLCSFNDSTVTVASEKVGDSQPAGFDADSMLYKCTSHYRIDQSMGSVLSFDGYNEIFHYFSDPNPGDGLTAGTGLEGDLEFSVRSVSSDSIVMVGKKHGATIRMYPNPSDQTWEDVIKEVEGVADYMNSRSYQLIVEGTEDTISVTKSYRRLVFAYTDSTGTSQTDYAPYVVTKEGLKFYKPGSYAGYYLTGFYKGTTDEYFEAMNNSSARIWTYVPPLEETLESGMWFISYKDLGEFAQPYWDVMHDALETSGPNNDKEILWWALIGTYSKHTAIHLQFGSNYAYYGLKFTSLNEEGNEVRIRINNDKSARNNAGKTYYDNYGLDQAMIPFVGTGTAGRNFVISTDSKRHPSYLILTDKDEPTNVIKLWAEQVTYVFGQEDAAE